MTGPIITTTFREQGASELAKAFAQVGESSEEMGSSVSSSSDSMREAVNRQEQLTEGFDTVDTRAMGFRDTLTGVQDGFEGLTNDSDSLIETMLLLGFGIGDLASGMVNFLIPAMASFWTWLTSTSAAIWLVNAAKVAWTAITGALTTAMTFLNTVIRANPIMFLVGLIAILVTAFLALWTKSEAFRNFFIGMFNGIRSAVASAVQWVVDRFNGLIDFFRNFPSRIGAALGAMGNVISGIFKGAVNVMIDALNWGIDRINNLIYGANLINPFEDIPSIPKIARMHAGGVVPGMPGQERLMLLQGGERVSTSSQGAPGGTMVTFSGDVDSAFATAFMKLVRSGDITLEAA